MLARDELGVPFYIAGVVVVVVMVVEVEMRWDIGMDEVEVAESQDWYRDATTMLLRSID